MLAAPASPEPEVQFCIGLLADDAVRKICPVDNFFALNDGHPLPGPDLPWRVVGAVIKLCPQGEARTFGSSFVSVQRMHGHAGKHLAAFGNGVHRK